MEWEGHKKERIDIDMSVAVAGQNEMPCGFGPAGRSGRVTLAISSIGELQSLRLVSFHLHLHLHLHPISQWSFLSPLIMNSLSSKRTSQNVPS